MTEITIRKTESLKGEVCAPPSKPYTQRMLIAAALAQGTSKLSNPLLSEDTEATVRAVKALGAKVTTLGDCWTVKGANPLKASKKPIDCGESGATLRFMIPVAALAVGPSTFILGSGLAKRPIEPLLESLKKLGSETYVEKKRNGKVAVRVEGGGFHGGRTSMPGDVSSQFVSGLMFACPLAEADTILTLTTLLESKSYVLMTENVLEKHGVKVDIAEDFTRVKIPAKQTYQPVDSRVPGDFSSAAFLLSAAAMITGPCRATKSSCVFCRRWALTGQFVKTKSKLRAKGNRSAPWTWMHGTYRILFPSVPCSPATRRALL